MKSDDVPDIVGGPSGEGDLRRSFRVTLVVLGVVALFVLAYVCRYVVFYLFAGVVIATALRTPIARLKARGLSHTLAATLVFGATTLGLLGALAVALPPVIRQLSHLWTALPSLYDSFRRQLTDAPGALPQRIGDRLPEGLFANSTTFDAIAVWAGGLLDPRSIASALFGVTAIVLLAFYWSLHEERTVRGGLLWVHERRRDGVREFIQTVQVKVGAFVRGQVVLCFIVGLLNFFALVIIGVPYAPGLAVLTGLLEAIPVFGPVLGAIPTILVAATLGLDKALWVAGAAFAIQQFESNVLLPRIMSRAVGVNALVTLLAMAAFGTLFGVLGMILAIPCAAVLQLTLDRFLLGSEVLQAEVPEGRDRLSRLRFAAAELAQDVRRTYRRQVADGAEPQEIDHHPLEVQIETLANDLETALASEASRFEQNGSRVGETSVVTITPGEKPSNVAALADNGSTMKRVALITTGATLAVGCAALIWSVRGVVLLLALAIALAAVLRPLQDLLHRSLRFRPAATALAYLMFCGLFLAPLPVVGPPLSLEIRRLTDDAVAAYDRHPVLAANLPSSLSPAATEGRTTTAAADSLPTRVFGATFGLFGFVVEAILVLALSIYWSLDREFFERLWLSLVSARRRAAARETWQTVEAEVGAYFRSELLQVIGAAALLVLGYRLLGHPYPIVAAICGGILWLIPWVGVVFTVAVVLLTALPLAVLAGPVEYLWAAIPSAIFALAVLWWLEFIVEPRLFGRRRYNTLFVAVVTLALFATTGVAGLLLGPPLAMALEIALGELLAVAAREQHAGEPRRRLTLIEAQAAELTTELANSQSTPKELVGLAARLSDLVHEVRRKPTKTG